MISRRILLSLIMIFFGIGFAGAATLNVGKGETYATIQSAVEASNTGDVISVGEGIYEENLIIKKNGISLIGKNREKTIIDGKKTGTVVKIDQAGNVRISGFTIQNSGGSGKEDAGVTIYSAKNNVVENSIFIDNIVGISIYSVSNNNLISGNDIKSSYNYGIFIYSSGDNEIHDNNIMSNKFGIYADSARMNKIYSNNFVDNTNQAFDNSGLNSWDDGISGNYWSDFKGSGAYTISGEGKAKDNYPSAGKIAIKAAIPDTPEQKTAQGETGKSTPGFPGIAVLAMLISIGILRNRK